MEGVRIRLRPRRRLGAPNTGQEAAIVVVRPYLATFMHAALVETMIALTTRDDKLVAIARRQ